MIKKGMIIKHDKFMDVAFDVHQVLGPFGSNQYLKIKGEWINQGFVKSYYIGERQVIKVASKNVKHWSLCLDPNDHACLRNCYWSRLK